MTILGLKMMVKSGQELFIFKLNKFAAVQCKKIVSERLNWPGSLAADKHF